MCHPHDTGNSFSADRLPPESLGKGSSEINNQSSTRPVASRSADPIRPVAPRPADLEEDLDNSLRLQHNEHWPRAKSVATRSESRV